MMLALWFSLAAAQEPTPDRRAPPTGSLADQAGPILGAEPAPGSELEEPGLEDTGEAAPPWEPPQDDDAREDVLGPWPDGFRPGRDFQRGLDLVDPLSDRVVQAGDPYVDGLLHGPVAPQGVDAEQPSPAPEPDPEPGYSQSDPYAAEVPSGLGQSEAPLVIVQVPDQDAQRWHLLPVTPEPSVHKSVLAGLTAILLLLLARGLELGPLQRLPQRGLVPLGLRTAVVALRLGVLTLVLLAGMLALPRSLAPAPAYVFVSLAIAVGWTSRHILGDFLAGVVLVIEHRVTTGARIHVGLVEGPLQGVVRGVGLRFVEIDADDGRHVSVPNRAFLERVVTQDDDSYVPVEVRVHVPSGHDAREVRRLLEELALLSPWLAPVGSPEVHRDSEARDVWVVRARLVDARHREAFRGTMVELADEALASPKP